MNPVAMTIINPRKEYWPSQRSHQRPPVLKSATLPTQLQGSALENRQITTLASIKSLLNDKLLPFFSPILKAFTCGRDNYCNLTQVTKMCLRGVEKIMETNTFYQYQEVSQNPAQSATQKKTQMAIYTKYDQMQISL